MYRMKYLLTDAGAELLAKIGASGKGLRFVRAQSGEGYNDDPEGMTGLADGQLDMQIAEVGRQGTVTSLTLLVTNHGLQEEHRIQQIGIFARDDETGREVLFIIGQNLNGDILPDTGYGRVEYRYVVNVTISNALDIVLDVNDTDFLLQKTFYGFIDHERVENAFYAVFQNAPYSAVAMSPEDVDAALCTQWDGQSSENPGAMSRESIESALCTRWDGQSSEDAGSLTSAEISGITD